MELQLPLPAGTIVVVHNLRNRLFLPQFGLGDVPLMISVVDIVERSYLQKAINQVGIKSYLGVSGPVIIDSGGFSFMAGAKNLISLDSVVSLYRTLGADLYASLDLPPTPGDTRKTRRRKWRITLSNFEFMLKELPGHRVIPIVHGHSLDELGQACMDIKRLIDRPTIISLGGMVPFLRGLMSGRRFHYRRANGAIASGHSFVADAITICRTEFPSSHLHVFGAGATTTAIALLVLGAHSVDSLSWRRAAGYGTIFLSGSAERSSRKNTGRTNRGRESILGTMRF